MKKQRIVIASLLKPVNDTRMFEKMGNSLARVYDVYVIGFSSEKDVSVNSSIHFLPHGPFKRISLQRFLQPFKIFKSIYKVKPEVLIVNTHELLIVAVLNRIFFGVRIVYDIQENYYRNILYSEAFPPFIRPILALVVRLKEKLLSPFFHQFLLAEKGYEKELHFLRKRAIVIENKCKLPPLFMRNPDPAKTTLLFSGTLAESTGIFQAIALAKKLHQISPKTHLNIIGYCALSAVLDRILEEIKDHDYIRLTGGDKLIPHTEIMDAIATASFGLICYPSSQHTENSIPTKLYEYLACRLPVILQHHAPWVDLCLPYQAAVSIDYMQTDATALWHQLEQQKFYNHAPENVDWTSEEKKLLAALSTLFPS